MSVGCLHWPRILVFSRPQFFNNLTSYSLGVAKDLPIGSTFLSGRSSSPGEVHPKALTEPCLSLSAHTALAIQRELTLSPQRPSSSSCCQLTTPIVA
jgi:hypothetical protein